MHIKEHPTAEQIELYVLSDTCGSLDEADPLTVEIEEHLLCCHDCVSKVQEEEAFVYAIRSSAAAFGNTTLRLKALSANQPQL